jgi:hypothetical protein
MSVSLHYLLHIAYQESAAHAIVTAEHVRGFRGGFSEQEVSILYALD